MSTARPNTFNIGEPRIADEGRIFIPADDRNEYGIEKDDCVHVTLETIHGEEFTVEYLPVRSKGDVNIPHRLLQVYGLSPGDEVSVAVRTTSVSLG